MANESKYDPKEIEPKWIEKWTETGIYKTPEDATRENKYYILPQLPYPSGSGLHVGHAEVYSACDIVARFKRMKGEKVLQVIGWDAFGLPAENFAIKTNVHPRINTDKAVDNFRDQITKMGVSVDWDREVGSHNPDYYKWTQWFFLLMYNQGLAYRKNQKVNWCPSCKTVLANEQVETKKVIEMGYEVEKETCERCDSEVEHKMMEQWYLKITDYADRLAEDLDKVDWPVETVKRQRDWIGRSEGIEIDFDVVGQDIQVTCFTTTPVNFGATFIVVAPEYEYLDKLVTKEQKAEVDEYVKVAVAKSELDRQKEEKTKTGVFTGSYAKNHLTGEDIPIWVADFVLASFGTGAVQGCPAHDERDFDFAKKFDLPIIRVVEGKNGETEKFVDPEKEEVDQVKIGVGIKRKMINSDFVDGLAFDEGMEKTKDYFEQKGWGRRVVTYKLRDWSVSRQRFWGAPIPMMHKHSAESEIGKYGGKPDTVVNIHAWGSGPNEVYHPWVGRKLAEKEIEYINPELPDTENPDFNSWKSILEESVKGKDLSNSIITGRSLGGWMALKFAENHKIRKLILVAPSTPTPRGFESWNEFATPEQVEILVKFIGGKEGNLDFAKVRENVEEIVMLHSVDDPYLNVDQSEKYLRTGLPFLRVRRYRESGHFTTDKGFDKFSDLFSEILAEVRPDLKPVSMDDLPVILPDDVDFKPTGESPLNYSKSFNNGVKEKYGKDFEREPDTLDTFMCSSWYYYRYLDPKNDKAFASPEALKKWMPVDFYLGGPEHVNGHLLYSRFFTKVLYDAGYIDFDEPFSVHRHQGLILGEDNRKMSKRWGNVINPSDVVDEHGADTLRMYEMFMGPLEDTKPWSSKGVLGIKRFLGKVWAIREKVDTSGNASPGSDIQETEINKLIKKVEQDTEKLSFNTAIAKMMEFVNSLQNTDQIETGVWKKFLLVLAPFAPFITEELWAELGNDKSIHQESWPKFEENKIVEEDASIAVQINGKLRHTVSCQRGASQKVVEELAKESEKIKNYLAAGEVKRVIYVQDRLINFVVA